MGSKVRQMRHVRTTRGPNQWDPAGISAAAFATRPAHIGSQSHVLPRMYPYQYFGCNQTGA